MRQVAFDELRTRHCSLMDARSLNCIGDDPQYTELARPVPTRPAVFSLFKQRYKNQLDVLARIVAYDFVVIDSLNRVNCRQEVPELDDLVFETNPTEEAYLHAKEGVQLFTHNSGGLTTSAKWTREDGEWWDALEKRYHDEMFRKYPVPAFADSDVSFPRTLFYIELSHIAGVSLFLSPGKRGLLQKIAEDVRADALTVVQNIPDRRIRSAVERELGPTGTSSGPFFIPPLPAYICKFASQEQISVLEAVRTIHGSDEAKSFRSWLHRLESAMLSGDRSDALKSAAMVEEIDDVAKKWATNWDAKCGIKYERRTAELSKLPRFGWIFELLGVGKLKITDPILTSPPHYLAFIAKWYDADVKLST